jgi:predicted ATPase
MSGDGPFSAGELRAGRPALKAVGHDKIVTPVIGVLAAEAEVRNGRADEARALVEELITEIRASGLRWQEAELLRVSGEARLLGPSADPDRAGCDLEAAVAVAREQGARAFQLRAALSLAKLYQSIARTSEAKSILSSALEGFKPTPEFPEIAKRRRYSPPCRHEPIQGSGDSEIGTLRPSRRGLPDRIARRSGLSRLEEL